MEHFNSVLMSIVLLVCLLFAYTNATFFDIQNNCPYTVWAASLPIGGGKQLKSGATWRLNVSDGTSGRIWGRTGCNFNSSGHGKCETGDCNGLRICNTSGTPPATLAEYNVNQNDLDFFGISLVDGFNVGMAINPIPPGCSRGVQCTADINEECPPELKVSGGCNNPCTEFNDPRFCCTNPSNCGLTYLSTFFKNKCPYAFANPYDDKNSTFSCPGGTNYKVEFCRAQFTPTSKFEIQNNSNFTIWAASLPIGGGMELKSGRKWSFDVPVGTQGGRIWARTGCNFDSSGRGRCQTGDCNGLLKCNTSGAPPFTLAQYSLNQNQSLDFFSISLLEGFNLQMEFTPTSNRCTQGIKCGVHIQDQCPMELKDPGGCNNPCSVFKINEYCCNSGKCGPTNFSKFFKDRCPDAYSYPEDNQTRTFTCPARTNYKVVFSGSLPSPSPTPTAVQPTSKSKTIVPSLSWMLLYPLVVAWEELLFLILVTVQKRAKG